MRHLLLAVSLMTLLSSTIGSAQTPMPAPRDSGAATPDSVRAFAPQIDAAPHEGRWICRYRSTGSCIFYAALSAAAIGYIVAEIASPKPEYERRGLLDGGSILGGETCVANCVPRKAIVFTISGAAIGAFGGWLLSRD